MEYPHFFYDREGCLHEDLGSAEPACDWDTQQAFQVSDKRQRHTVQLTEFPRPADQPTTTPKLRLKQMHSPEPWRPVDRGRGYMDLVDADGATVCQGSMSHPDMERVVLLVNACAGLSDDELETIIRTNGTSAEAKQ